MTTEEFDEKFSRLEKAHDYIMDKIEAITSLESENDEGFEEFMNLMESVSESIEKMCALVDKAMDELDDEDSSDTEENK